MKRQQLDTVKPKVVADKDTDIAAEDAAGEERRSKERRVGKPATNSGRG